MKVTSSLFLITLTAVRSAAPTGSFCQDVTPINIVGIPLFVQIFSCTFTLFCGVFSTDFITYDDGGNKTFSDL